MTTAALLISALAIAVSIASIMQSIQTERTWRRTSTRIDNLAPPAQTEPHLPTESGG